MSIIRIVMCFGSIRHQLETFIRCVTSVTVADVLHHSARFILPYVPEDRKHIN